MSPVQVLPFHPSDWDYYIAGPFLENFSFPSNFDSALQQCFTPGYIPQQASASAGRAIWTFNQGGGGVTKERIRYQNILAHAQATTIAAAIEGMGGVQIRPLTDRTGLAPGYVNPSYRRVHWLSMNLAMDSGTLDRNSGLILAGLGGPQPGAVWPIAPAALWWHGFGIVGDGAGNWNWENYAAGFPGTPVQESVSLASAVTDPEAFNSFDFVFISATGTRPAAFELWINGALFLQRNWETGITLDHLQAAPLIDRWCPIWQVGTTTGEFIYMADWAFRMGRYLPGGSELLS